MVEVEYVAVAVNSSNIMWIKKLLKCMKEEIADLGVIYCDKNNSINISKNHVMHTKTNHISIKHHYLRDLVQDNNKK